MPIKVSCPKCQAVYTIPADLDRRTVKCRQCQQMFLVGSDRAEKSRATRIINPSPALTVPPALATTRKPTQLSPAARLSLPQQPTPVATPTIAQKPKPIRTSAPPGQSPSPVPGPVHSSGASAPQRAAITVHPLGQILAALLVKPSRAVLRLAAPLPGWVYHKVRRGLKTLRGRRLRSRDSHKARGARLDLLHPASVVVFLLLALCWLLVWIFVDPNALELRPISRLCGYLATLALLVPYIHVFRRCFRYRDWGNMNLWLRWHIGAAYASFAFTLVHCRAHSNGPFTFFILCLFWAIMISGVLGFFGQQFLYRLVPMIVSRELGLERLELEAQGLLDRARELIAGYSLLEEEDVRDWPGLCAGSKETNSRLRLLCKRLPQGFFKAIDAVRADESNREAKQTVLEALNSLLLRKDFYQPEAFAGLTSTEELNRLLQQDVEQLSDRDLTRRNRLLLESLCPPEIVKNPKPPGAIERFIEKVVEDCLQVRFTAVHWIITWPGFTPIAENHYTRARQMATPRQGKIIDELWQLTGQWRKMAIEYWCHLLGRLWLLVHSPAAVALLVLVVVHVVMSVKYGGF